MIEIFISEKSGSPIPTEPIKLELNKNKQLPPLTQQIKNFTTSVTRHVIAGTPQATDSEREKRMSICRNCPLFNGEDPENPRCNECGCYLKIKTSWALESCPQKKWGPTAVSGGCGCKN